MNIEFGRELTIEELEFIKTSNNIPDVGCSQCIIESRYYVGDGFTKNLFGDCWYTYSYEFEDSGDEEYTLYYSFYWTEKVNIVQEVEARTTDEVAIELAKAVEKYLTTKDNKTPSLWQEE